MKKPTKAAIVGAGGIGCYLAPMLCRLMDVVIIDGDKYEKKNVERQFPALLSDGNKARVLAEMLAPTTLNKVTQIEGFLKGIEIISESAFEGVDIIFGAVDNNKSRRLIEEVCLGLEIPAIIAGNEHEHGEAHLIAPGLHSPFDHFDFPDNQPTPWGCNTDAALDENPQTAIANMLAAGAAMHLYISWVTAIKPEFAIAYTRLDTFFSESKRIQDFEKE